uniref:Carnitine O-acetyltransferase a n=1 Tax=Amphilophus citrinellus TaxID=61819 RepID=A0A3Q0RPX7_AMPCI
FRCVKVGMMNSCHLMKPVSGILVNGRYLTYQQGLPSLPVPPLQQTCERYLSLLEPIVEVHELKRTKQLVEKFLESGGVGEKLQRSLERKAQNTNNWVSLTTALKTDYLDNRLPVVVYSNNSGAFPRMDFRDKQGQIRCAAEIMRAILDFKTMVDNEMLPVDYLGGKPLCMKQYSQMLSSCSIPGLEGDSIVFHSKTSCPSNQFTVAHNSQFFMVDVYNSDGTPMTVHQLCVQLERICNSSLETNTEPVGILTTLNRDYWSKCYDRLVQDQTNKEALLAIQRSICVVCLDKAMPHVPDEMYCRRNALQMMHGGGSQWNSANRWFDKSVQFIIGEDGAFGNNISHSCADGTIAMALIDYVLNSIKKLEIIQSPMVPLPMPQKLHFSITPDIKKAIEEAKESLDKLAQDLDINILLFNHFGKNVLKANKMSSDAFVQMAIQLAYYRVHQQHCPSYEAASMRMFKQGRVCEIPSTSSASVAFATAFDDPKTQKRDLLMKAIKVHKWSTNMEISGQTLFGHFLGLQCQATETNIPMPEIFTDTSFVKAFDYRLATSQVPSNSGCLPCAGPYQLEAYDICYKLLENDMTFVVSAFKTSKENNPAQLNQALEDALLDMRTILEI